MSREERLEKAYKVANELRLKYSFDKEVELTRLCQDDIFYCVGDDNDFYLEDDHFYYEA